jgi:HSP20 family protein
LSRTSAGERPAYLNLAECPFDDAQDKHSALPKTLTFFLQTACVFLTQAFYIKGITLNLVKEVAMSNLTRWEPVREMMTLREAMDRLFDDAFTRPINLRDGGWSAPALDMYQTDDEVVVKAALPGFKADEVQINITGDVLTIRGEMKHEEEQKERAWHIREQRWGSFERSVALPTAVTSDKASADFENGILTIALPKAEEVKPKTITVKAK